MVFADHLFVFLTARPFFLYSFLFSGHLVGAVTLPFEGVGVDFEESRTFDSCCSSWNRGLHEIPIVMYINGSSEWASIVVIML